MIGIANVIPSNIRTVILFESWDKDFNLTKVIHAFKGRCKAKKISRQVPWGNKSTNFKKFFLLFLSPIIHTKILEINNEDISGDIILEIN